MATLGIELELSVLLALAVLGAEIFAPFEVETPVWKKLVKWSLTIFLTLGLFPYIGHWAAVVALGLGLLGLGVHFAWCARNGIHPMRATPRRRSEPRASRRTPLRSGSRRMRPGAGRA